MTLFAHQKTFLDSNVDKSALVWSCGTGKTLTAILWAKSRGVLTLIITPKALKTNWQIEVAKYADAYLFKIVTKEEFRRDHKKLERYSQIIVDEIHLGFLTPLWKSQMSKALKNYIKVHKVDRFLGLSATPYSASPWNIYNLAYLLGHQWKWQQFKLKFFFDVRMGMRIIPMAKKGCEKELARLVRKIASVVDINDVIDVPLQNHAEPEYFALNKEQIKAIESNYDPLPIVRYTKQHECENGFFIDGEDVFSFPYDKTERLQALVDENKKIAIVCRYNAQIDALASVLSESSPFIIRGDTPNRHKMCELAEKAEKAVVLIQADCNTGYQLPSFELCVFMSQSYSYVAWQQMQGRFLRVDKPSRTTFLYLLTEGDSIDKAVYECIKRKEDFKIELLKK